MGKRGRPPYPDLLTPREWEVLELLRQGLSNPEIADRLGISRDGAKYHVSEILSKLGLTSRDEAARWRPERPPWWAAALAPVATLWHRARSALPIRANSLALAAASGLVVALLVGAGLTAVLLFRTNRDGEGQPAQASVTPLGTPLALDGTSPPLRPDASELYVANPDGSALRRLFVGAGDAALSPDGRRVAVTSPIGKETVLSLVELTTGESRELLRSSSSLRLAKWSPDGALLALDRFDPDAQSSWVEAYELDTGTVSRLPVSGAHFVSWSPSSDAALVQAGGPARPGSAATLYRVDVPSLQSHELLRADDFRDIAYSPDGRLIAAVEVFNEGTNTRMALAVMRPDGSEQRDLFNTNGQTTLGVLAWSPDSGLLAFSVDSYTTRGGIGVHIADLQSGETTPLTRPQEGFDSPATWSPDRQRLLVNRVNCISCEPGLQKLLLVDVASRSETILTETGEYFRPTASWSPDGSRLLYAGYAVYVANADGSNAHQIGDFSAAGFGRASWSLEGSQIMFLRSYLPFATFSSNPDGSDPRFLGPQVVSVAPSEQALVQRVGGGALVRWLGEGTEVSVEGYVSDAAWAPDGTAVALQRAGPPPMKPVVIVKQDGNTRAIASESASGPRWSPDSRRLAYWADGAVWVVDRSGETPARSVAVGPCCAFDWSPAGNDIAVANDTDVFAVRLDGAARRELFELQPRPFYPHSLRWAPSNDNVAVAGRGGLLLGSATTGAVRVLADNADGGVAWSPTGDALAFGANVDTSLVPGLYVVDVENGDLAPLTEVTGFYHGVRDWLADGRIVFWTYSLT